MLAGMTAAANASQVAISLAFHVRFALMLAVIPFAKLASK
jgi:hypothetical protein